MEIRARGADQVRTGNRPPNSHLLCLHRPQSERVRPPAPAGRGATGDTGMTDSLDVV